MNLSQLKSRVWESWAPRRPRERRVEPSVALALIFLAAILVIWCLFKFPLFPLDDFYRQAALRGIDVAVITTCIAVLLSLTRFTSLGSLLLAAGNTVGIVKTILGSPNDQVLEKTLMAAMPWLAFSVLICGLTLSRRGIYATTGIIVAVCFGIMPSVPTLLLHEYVVSVIFIITISSMAIIFAVIRENNARHEGEQQAKMILAAKLSALGQMAGGIAHEINSPLALIHTLAGQLGELLEENATVEPMVKSMVLEIESTSVRISQIINGLRSVSRNEHVEAFKSTPVAHIVEDTLVFCRDRFKHHGIALAVEYGPKGALIECHAGQISQVILNLLNNAHDAVENLPIKWVKLSVKDLGESVEIAVTDSGAGIAPEIQKKLFHSYFTTKAVGKGTGLGLGISKKLVEVHHGRLKLDLRSRNTRFVVQLPKNQNSPSQFA